MYWYDRLAIVSAIISAGDTITGMEAEDIVASHGGDPNWVDDPPPWVVELNARLRKFHRQEGMDNERERHETGGTLQ